MQLIARENDPLAMPLIGVAKIGVGLFSDQTTGHWVHLHQAIVANGENVRSIEFDAVSVRR